MPDETDRLTAVLQVLCVYADVVSSASVPAAHLVGMLEAVSRLSERGAASSAQLQLQMLRLLSTTDGRQIGWTKQARLYLTAGCK